MAGGGEAVHGGIDAARVVFGHGLTRFLDGRLDLLGLGVADLGAMLFEGLLHVVDHGVGAVAGFDGVALLAVFGRVPLGVLGHLVDLILRKAR